MTHAAQRMKKRARRFQKADPQKILAALRAALPGIARAIPLNTAAMFLTLAECLSIHSPFGVCLALARASLGASVPLCGLLAGFCLRLLWGAQPDIWQYIACAAAPFLSRRIAKSEGIRLSITAFLLLLPRCLFALPGGGRAALLALFSALLGGLCAPAFKRALQTLRDRDHPPSSDGALCVILFFLVTITGLASARIFCVNLGFLAACVVVLTAAYLGGAGVSACAGILCALSLTLRGQDARLMICLPFAGVLASVARGRARVLSLCAFLPAILLTATLCGMNIDSSLIITSVCAGIAFLCAPRDMLSLLSARVRMIRPESASTESDYLRARLFRWADKIELLSRALPEASRPCPSPMDAAETLAERLCEGCDRLPVCYRDQYDETRAQLLKLVSGDAEDFQGCARAERLPGLLAVLNREAQAARARETAARQEREMTRINLLAASRAVTHLSGARAIAQDEDARLITLAEEALIKERIPARLLYIRRVDGHITAALSCDAFTRRRAENVAARLSARLQKPLRFTGEEGSHIYIEESPPMELCAGVSAVGAGGDEQIVCGDASLIRILEGGYALAALSDGMGHGGMAREESQKTLELLALCLDAGYTRAQALAAVNGMMLSATGGESYATVDLCVIDLWQGRANMMKLGAGGSLLVRGARAQWIEGAALPLGVLANVVPMEHTLSLSEGDCLILMSDGAAEALGTPEEIAALALSLRQASITPQSLADALLRRALLREDCGPKDDMTFVCVSLTARTERSARKEA